MVFKTLLVSVVKRADSVRIWVVTGGVAEVLG